MDSESKNFPICSNLFGSTKWQHQWQCQHSYLVPIGESISVIWFVLLEVQVVPVCWNSSFGPHSTQWHWRLEEKRGGKAHEKSLPLETSGCIQAKGLLGPKSCCSHSLSVLCASWCLQGEAGRLAGHLLHSICNPGRRIKATYCFFNFFV